MKAREIAEMIGGELIGDGNAEVDSVAAIEDAVAGQLAFSTRVEHASTAASCLIVPPEYGPAATTAVIRVQNPKLAFANAAKLLLQRPRAGAFRHELSDIALDAIIGEDVSVGAFASIGSATTIGKGTSIGAGVRVGDRVSIGANCRLHPNVVVESDCVIGHNVELHAGSIIGADGFGYVADECGNQIKFPQVGRVVIEDDVEIGANTCIDRGSLGETRIGKGTKIDNLVQIAHNVQIGRNVVIAAQTGISGSTIIEDGCVIGGQVGMGDHAVVKSGAIIGSQAGILPGKIVRSGIWWGTPVQPLDEYKRQNAMVKGIERLRNDVKELKNKLERR